MPGPLLSGLLDVVIDLFYGEHAILVDVHEFKVLEGRVQEFLEPELVITALVVTLKFLRVHHVLDIVEDQITLVVRVPQEK